jgi:hypothetical protein
MATPTIVLLTVLAFTLSIDPASAQTAGPGVPAVTPVVPPPPMFVVPGGTGIPLAEFPGVPSRVPGGSGTLPSDSTLRQQGGGPIPSASRFGTPFVGAFTPFTGFVGIFPPGDRFLRPVTVPSGGVQPLTVPSGGRQPVTVPSGR